MVPENKVVQVYDSHIAPHWPFRRTPEQMEEDLNNSIESDQNEDNVFDKKLNNFIEWWEQFYIGKKKPNFSSFNVV